MRRGPILAAALWPLAVVAWPVPGAAQVAPPLELGDFRFVYHGRGISGLAHPGDPYGAEVVPVAERLDAGGDEGAGRPGTLTLTLAYREGSGPWVEPVLRDAGWTADPGAGTVRYRSGGGDGPLAVAETFSTDGRLLDWTIELQATRRVTVGDLAISVPAAGPRGPTPEAIFEHGFLRHQLIAGAGSFFFFTRASGAPPFLVVTPHSDTWLEYFTGSSRGGGRLFVHSARSGPGVEATWRRPHTARVLDPSAPDGGRIRYGFRFRWADSYDAVRQILYEEGLFDVRVVPGMTVPRGLRARISLHTQARIDGVEPEYPGSTTVSYVGEPRPDHHVYEIGFQRLGENLLTVRHDGARETTLEFFVTEPLETLIQKRAEFLVERQQVRDTTVWWDGVFGPYDMREGVTRTIEDPDIFVGRMVYVLTCDDPGLSKAPFLASKNVHYPVAGEVEALEYYIDHFLWGGMQRTDAEEPYPFGVYGTPNWWVNRSPERRAEYTDRDLDREHVWRSYDYPHVVMLYYHMYQIASMYPGLTRRDAAEYLERAWGTARAFYDYPYAIYPDYYETYKWGLYNELVVLDLIRALEREGFPSRADHLRSEWEKKVKYFVYDDPYPFRSEYPFDRTAYESSYALAKYGATHDMEPDEHLWWDVQEERWYSHPVVRREDARAFMGRQLAANLAVRGWLETSYYQLGADPSLSYMAAMGGWGILDYGIRFAPDPHDWLQLGYASYLSSWALMNTGTPESGYGYWFPGDANDGAAGWQFMSAKRGSAWMGSSYPGGVQVPRGPWHYDGEIDLGFGGALRMARTLVTRDPLFGWLAYGGTWSDRGDHLEVVPRDGLRKRLTVVLPDARVPGPESRRLDLELDRDGFARDEVITMEKAMGRIAFTVENRTGDTHETVLSLWLPYGTAYELLQDGQPVDLVPTGHRDHPWQATLRMEGGPATIELAAAGNVEEDG